MSKRNYRAEYDRYQGRPEQIKRRAARNKARAKMIKLGRARKGDGKDVHHRNNRPKDNSARNLAVISKSRNRSFRRKGPGKGRLYRRK
mgnify:CR=1 FL=1